MVYVYYLIIQQEFDCVLPREPITETSQIFSCDLPMRLCIHYFCIKSQKYIYFRHSNDWTSIRDLEINTDVSFECFDGNAWHGVRSDAQVVP